MAYDVLMSR